MNVLVFLNEGIYKFVKSALVNANKLWVSVTHISFWFCTT